MVMQVWQQYNTHDIIVWCRAEMRIVTGHYIIWLYNALKYA